MVEKHKGLARIFREFPDSLMSFLMRFASGEPRDEDYDEPLFEVLDTDDGSTELERWIEAETLVFENNEGFFTCEESLEFQATWSIRKLVPGKWNNEIEVGRTCPVYGANPTQVSEYGAGFIFTIFR